MPKDAKNLEGVDHREWHNLYGYYMQQATAEGLTQRSLLPNTKPLRPFVLTRAFWAGSQRFGAMWTGDNTAEWGHLQIAAPMLLSINLAGLSFAGADVGGFFGEPGPELFTRWYQAAAFTPFFRGHAHHDTKRREPWVFGDPYTGILRNIAMVRYTLLCYWYTVFYEAYTTGSLNDLPLFENICRYSIKYRHQNHFRQLDCTRPSPSGMPVMRTMFTEFPDDESTFAMDDQWMVGSALLVKPATSAGQTDVQVYLPSAASSAVSFATDGWFEVNLSASYNSWS